MNIRMCSLGPLTAAFVILTAAGCSSGSSKGGGGGFSTSVPASTKLTALTPGQAQQLCTDVEAYDERTLTTVICKETGLEAAVFLAAFSSSPPSDADLQATCAQAYDGCVHPDAGAADGGVTGTTTANCDPTAIMSQPATCQATVADFTTCVSDLDAAYLQAAATIPDCSALTAAAIASYTSSSDAGTATTTTAEPVSCSKFSSTCNVQM